MSDQYIYLDRNERPPVPQFFEDYEALLCLLLADRRRQTGRHIVIALPKLDLFPSIDTRIEFYPADMWFDAHIEGADVSEVDEVLLESWSHPLTGQDLRFLIEMRHRGREEDNTSLIHTVDELIRQLVERLPGRYDRQDVPGTLIPSQANYAHLLPNGIRFDSFDCDELLHINTDAAEYFTTRDWIESHWNKIKPSLELGCPEVQTYECGHTWIG